MNNRLSPLLFALVSYFRLLLPALNPVFYFHNLQLALTLAFMNVPVYTEDDTIILSGKCGEHEYVSEASVTSKPGNVQI